MESLSALNELARDTLDRDCFGHISPGRRALVDKAMRVLESVNHPRQLPAARNYVYLAGRRLGQRYPMMGFDFQWSLMMARLRRLCRELG